MESQPHQTESPETPSPPAFRSFAELHHDVWEVVKRSPVVFVLVPALLWLPTDAVLEILSRDPDGDWLKELRTYLRWADLANAFVGTLVSAVFLAALTEMGTSGRVDVRRAWSEGLLLWGHLVGLFFLIAIRVLVGFLLLVIPGIYLVVRYALAFPAAAFGGSTGGRALKASAELMKGKYLRVTLGVMAAAVLYSPVALAPTMLVPPEADVWLTAAAGIPVNVLGSFVTIALALIYVDSRPDVALLAPVGTKALEERAGMPRPSRGSGRRGVATTALASALCVILACFSVYWYGLKPIQDGDEAWNREAYGEALKHYRRAARWDPEDANVQYSIGWALFVLHQPVEAKGHLEQALKIDPGNAGYHVDHARVLMDLEEFSRARNELAIARRQGFANVELLDELEALLEQMENPPQMLENQAPPDA